MPKLIVFLGNPGIQYRQTRHNAGWILCDRVTERLGLDGKWQTKFHGLFIKNGNSVLLKPQTFMNESGFSIQEASRFFNIKPQEILVVHDDIELEFGEVRMQLGGGMGGHNGLRSVRQHLGTDQFRRLRIGVGRPPARIQVADYVLGRFTEIEEKQLQDILENASETALEYICN
ncbi:MAG: aminoacyl-tRNA hydrolase [Spirochaetales bacterium]|nr:aminoacyl-tRNA hydrolase [Spirochaetales bacterium]